MSQTPDQRVTALQAFRDMVTFLEAHPEIPVPTHSCLNAFLLRGDGSEAQRFRALFDVADVFEEPATEDSDGDRKTEKRFGTLTLAIHAQGDRKQPSVDRVVTRPALECLEERIEHVEAVTTR